MKVIHFYCDSHVKSSSSKNIVTRFKISVFKSAINVPIYGYINDFKEIYV